MCMVNVFVSFKRTRLDSDNRAVEHDAKEACDIIITQIGDRFESNEVLRAFSIVDPQKFSTFKNSFPANYLIVISYAYPMLNKEKLKSELSAAYNNDILCVIKVTVIYYYFCVTMTYWIRFLRCQNW